MKLTLQAEWIQHEAPWHRQHELVIGGYYAHVYSRGDYVAWDVTLSSFKLADVEIAHGTADPGDFEVAKAAAERAIAKHAVGNV